MARKTQIVRTERRDAKYPTRHVNRCSLCGRGRAYMRKFKICRLCFRKLSSEGKIPGVRKASW